MQCCSMKSMFDGSCIKPLVHIMRVMKFVEKNISCVQSVVYQASRLLDGLSVPVMLSGDSRRTAVREELDRGHLRLLPSFLLQPDSELPRGDYGSKIVALPSRICLHQYGERCRVHRWARAARQGPRRLTCSGRPCRRRRGRQRVNEHDAIK
jgi:hypothetical protein